MKLAGEQKIAAICPNRAILRTAWVFSPFGANFLKTMLLLGEKREELGVVADQLGNPTYAIDIADALFAIAQRMRADSSDALRGVFHITGAGEASWADFAEAVLLTRPLSGVLRSRLNGSRLLTIRRRRSARPIFGSTIRS